MAPSFHLAEDSTALAGSLLREVVLQLPASGAADSDLVIPLWQPGELRGPAIIEIAGAFQLDAGTTPVTGALTSGALLWYSPAVVAAPSMAPPGSRPGRAGPGDVVLLTMVREVLLSFEAVPPGDTVVRLDVSLAGPRDSVRLVDEAATGHGRQLRWFYGDGNTSLGSPGDLDPGCAFLGAFGCAPLPPLDAAHTSASQPHGSVRVRVYQMVGEAPVLRVRLAPEGEGPVRPLRTGGVHTLNLRVAVVDTGGQPVPDRTVRLALDGLEGTGGHNHGETMPPGGLSAMTVETGVTGIATVRYTAAAFAGGVEIRGTSEEASDAVDTIAVAVPGLVELQDGGSMDTIGIRAQHPDSHWGTPSMVAALRALAQALQAHADTLAGLPDSVRPKGRFPRVLGVNDMSLPLGGKFDLAADYSPAGGHEEHRSGRDADIDVRQGSDDDALALFVQSIWVDAFGHALGDERATRNHYHLRF